jgi:hypothetical protein
MRLTKRCADILPLLRAARWLTTGQVHRRFFPNATVDAARKRLCKLTQGGYLVKFQEHHMAEALFTLGREGKRVLEQSGAEEIVLERKPPKQLEHFTGINDVRIAAELAGSLAYFFACWELPGVGWRHPVIPDAVFSMCGKTFAMEFDRGVESVRFFVRTKIALYRRGLAGFPLTAVLVVADRKARAVSLARNIPNERGQFLFATLEDVRTRGLFAPVWYRRLDADPVSLFSKSLLEVSRREESFLSRRGNEPMG